MIQTEKFEIRKKEYLSIVYRVVLKKKWWLFAIAWFAGLLILLDPEKDFFKILIMILFFAYPLIVLFEFWRFANSKQNKLFFVERRYEFFNDKMVSYVGENSESTIALENFVKTFELNDVYLLYISKNSSVYFPKRIFRSIEDENWFRENIFMPVKRK